METKSAGGMLPTENEKVEEGGMLISCCLILGVNRTTWTRRRASAQDYSHHMTQRSILPIKFDV